MNLEKRETMSDKALWTHARCCTCEDCIPWVTVWYYGYDPLISEDMVSFVDTQNAYNQGIIDERNRIVERLKDNLNPSVYDTVIRIIHAA